MRSRAPFAVRGYAFSPENVGTLVCPAIYDLGEAVTVVALSVTEGEDKPLQYAPMFRGADAPGLTELGAPLSGPVRAVADVAVEINRHRLEEQRFSGAATSGRRRQAGLVARPRPRRVT